MTNVSIAEIYLMTDDVLGFVAWIDVGIYLMTDDGYGDIEI